MAGGVAMVGFCASLKLFFLFVSFINFGFSSLFFSQSLLMSSQDIELIF